MHSSLRGRAGALLAQPIAILAAVLTFMSPAVAQQQLTLRQALTLARGVDPGLPAAEARIEAAFGALRQAGVKPNPSIGADLENFPATSHTPIDRTEVTVYYQQLLERGDKRLARTGVARAEIELARLRRTVRALDLFRQVQAAWDEAVAAQISVQIAEEQLATAQSLQMEINRRVEAARDPLFAGARIDTQVIQAQIAVDQARLVAQNARAALVAYLGEEAGGPLDVSDYEQTDLDLMIPAESPDIALLEATREVANAHIAFERSRAVPDLTLRGGVRYLQSGNDLALVVGGSIPLGINDTNRGNIERAEAERTAAEQEIAVARLSRSREIVRLQARLNTNATEVRRIQAEVLPKAEETLALVREGFNRGGFSYIDVIDAQRALIDARARRIEILKSFHADRAVLDRFIARHIDLVPTEETQP